MAIAAQEEEKINHIASLELSISQDIEYEATPKPDNTCWLHCMSSYMQLPGTEEVDSSGEVVTDGDKHNNDASASDYKDIIAHSSKTTEVISLSMDDNSRLRKKKKGKEAATPEVSGWL